jgi:TPR repeat protein
MTVCARLGVNAMVAFVTLCACLLALAEVPRAEDSSDGWMPDFYTYLPAAPELKMPDINILPFWTDDLKKAKRAYRDGEYGKARKYFEKESEDGNIVADWYLGHIYRLGRGVTQDNAKAYSYYSRVADQFDDDERDEMRLRICVDALVRIADYHRTGDEAAGIPRDYPRAIRIYRLATTYGHPAAQYALGLMSLRGQGMKKNPGQGLKWLLAAARKRYAPAEAKLGDLYWDGDMVASDRTRAVMWYILAKATAKPEEYPQIYDHYDAMLAEVSEEERLEAEARATVWAEQYPTGSNQAPQPGD